MPSISQTMRNMQAAGLRPVSRVGGQTRESVPRTEFRLRPALQTFNNRHVAAKRMRMVGARLNDEESAVVEALAEETGLSLSDVLRQALRAAHPERFKKPKPPRQPKK